MQITFLGYFMIPMGVFLLLRKKEYLLYLTIVFSGWSSAGVILIEGIGYALQPAYWFMMLYLFKCFILCFLRHKFEIYKPPQGLVLFVIIAFVSLVNTLLGDSSIAILNGGVKSTRLEFGFSNIKQLAYLTFCFIVYIAIRGYSYKKPRRIENMVKAFVVGTFLTCVVTIYQMVAFKYGWPFDDLFRQGYNGNVQGTRIYGPCIEASMLMYYLVGMLPLCRSTESNKFMKGITIVACIVLGVISYSTTFLLGAVVWIFFEMMELLKGKKISRITLGGIVLVFILTFVTNSIWYPYVSNALIKASTTVMRNNVSGTVRSNSFWHLINNVWMKHPFIGVGWGTNRGNDYISTLLANVGILGTGTFIGFLINKVVRRKDKVIAVNYDSCIRRSCVIVWLCIFVSVPEPYNLFIWILLALL